MVYALEAQTGKQIWQVKLASLVSQTSLSRDTLYVVTTAYNSSSTPSGSSGAPSGTVSALNARTGTQQWSRQTGVQVSAIVATSTAVLVAETTRPSQVNRRTVIFRQARWTTLLPLSTTCLAAFQWNLSHRHLRTRERGGA